VENFIQVPDGVERNAAPLHVKNLNGSKYSRIATNKGVTVLNGRMLLLDIPQVYYQR